MGHTPRPAPAAWVGIDVSQHTLDACFLPGPAGKPCSREFANDDAGHAALAAWADSRAGGAPVGFCLESTGAYGEALACALAEGGRHAAVVNPARVKYAGLMRGCGNKTDKADAKLIAEYATRERPPAWPPPRPAPAGPRAARRGAPSTPPPPAWRPAPTPRRAARWRQW